MFFKHDVLKKFGELRPRWTRSCDELSDTLQAQNGKQSLFLKETTFCYTPVHSAATRETNCIKQEMSQ